MIPAAQLAILQTFIDRVFADLEPAQEAYFATHGRYFQFLPTHVQRVPGERPSTRLDVRPSDQAESIRDVLGSAWDGLRFPANVRCDVYESNEGHGWMLVAEVEGETDATLNVRTVATGPLAPALTRDWERVEPLEVIDGAR